MKLSRITNRFPFFQLFFCPFPSILITKRIFPMYKLKIPTALATITFPTTIFLFLPGISPQKKKRNCTDVRYKINRKWTNSGFHRFYGYFLNGEVLSIHRSPFPHLINVIGNLYSSRSLALPMNYRVIGLFSMGSIHTVTAFNYEG